jgi:hypothetical protein
LRTAAAVWTVWAGSGLAIATSGTLTRWAALSFRAIRLAFVSDALVSFIVGSLLALTISK